MFEQAFHLVRFIEIDIFYFHRFQFYFHKFQSTFSGLCFQCQFNSQSLGSAIHICLIYIYNILVTSVGLGQ